MISTLTINTALDQLLFIEEFQKNNTNRIQKSAEVLGGKGTHVSLNLSELGARSRCFGVTRGGVGKRIQEILTARGNIDVHFLYKEEGDSRRNFALIESNGTCTLVVEKGALVEREECMRLVDLIDEHIEPGDDLVLSGDASNTAMPFLYNVIMQRLSSKQIRFFLDTSSQNLIEGLRAKPFLVKPNLDELSQIVGKPVKSEAAILEAMNDILGYGVQVVAVSCGGEGSYVKTREETYRVFPLQVRVRNTIGCGDAYLSGLVYGFSQNKPLEQTLKLAAAVSAATAESELTVGFDLARALALVDRVRLQKLE